VKSTATLMMTVLIMLSGAVSAGTIVSVADGTGLEVADGSITATATGEAYMYVGTYVTMDAHAGIFFIPLPVLPAGDIPVGANLTLGLTYCSTSGESWNIDLYALGVTDSPALDPASQYYLGANDTSAVRIQDNLVSPGSHPDQDIDTDASGDAELTTWLRDQYTDGTPNAAYAVFRLNLVAAPGAIMKSVRFKASDAAYGDTGQSQPTLTLEHMFYSAPTNEWRVMPIRSEEEHNLGWIGGETEQHPHGIARCLYHPNVIYWSHDVGAAWRSDNAGKTWKKTIGEGLHSRSGQSIEVDPVDPNTVFIITDNSGNYLIPAADEGLYRSRDGGETFEQVLSAAGTIFRIYRHNIAYDLASVTSSNATRWYAAFPNGGLHRSDDGGDTWALQSSLAGHSTVYAVQTHPSDGQTVYVASSSGLYASSAQGAGLAPLGDLPGGAVSSVQIHPDNPNIVYATLRTQGLYRSLNGGTNFTLLRSFDAGRVFLNPGYPEVIYLSGISANTITSHDGGTNWITNMTTVPAPGLGRAGSGWKGAIAGGLTGIVPNPEDPDEAVAFSRATMWKTTNGGQTFVDSSTLFTGYAPSWGLTSIAFDPFNPDRFAFFNNDVGMTITDNHADYFDRRNDQAWDWRSAGYISWIGTYSGGFQPIDGSQVIVASVGNYFATEIMRTTNEGQTWSLVTSTDHRNFFVSFHPDDPDVVYAGDKISHDAGATFSNVDFGSFSGLSPEIVGMCRAQADTIYAMDVPNRQYLLRSDDRGTNWYEYAHPGWSFRRLDSFPTFAADPVDPDKVYTLNSSYDLAIFDGSTWTDTGVLALSGGSSHGNFVRRIAVDPIHPEVIYAGMNGVGIPCVFRSTDGGSLWTDITANSSKTSSDALHVNPHTGEVFRGTLQGTWVYPPPAGFSYPTTNLIHDKLLTYAEVETPPTLEITPVPGDQLTISWSPDVPIWLLEQTTNLVSSAWSNAPSGPTNPVTVPVTDQMFYRLGL